MKSWEKGLKILLERNPFYHGRYSGNLVQLELIVETEDAQLELLGEYEEGRLDAFEINSATPEDLVRIRRLFAGEYFSYPEASVFGVNFNTAQAPFDDVNVRMALNLAIDRESLFNRIFQGFFIPASGGLVPPALHGHCPGIGLVYDPEAARRKLAEAGYPGGSGFPAIEILAADFPLNILGVNTLCAQWQKYLGISIEPRFAPFAEILSENAPNQASLWTMGWRASIPDPREFLQPGVIAQRNTNWRDKAYEETVARAKQTQDPVQRIALYHHAEEILVAQVPVFPIGHGRRHLLLKPWLKKYPVSPIRDTFFKDVVIEE